MMFSFNEYLFLALSYILGSIPFGLIIVKFYGLGNISKQGSGNIGATNVARVAGKKLGIMTFLLDFLKGVLPVLLYMKLFPDSNYGHFVSAGLAVLGHIFTPWLKFRGGKGVATGLGTVFAINYMVGILCIVTWLICFKITRISSVSALLCYGLMPIFFYFMENNNDYIMHFSIFLSIAVFIKHHANIKRLLNGEETSFKKG